MVLRENSSKPRAQYWEHENKPHQCNHYECNGVIKVSKIIHKDKEICIAEGYCEGCGQRYLIGEPPVWFNQEEKSNVLMQRKVEERRRETWPELKQQNISQLIKGILTATK